MKFEPTPIDGLIKLSPEVFEDARGEFVEVWHQRNYNALPGAPVPWKTDSYATSYQGVLKGLHGDWKTWKLVDVAYGRIFIVVADCRVDGNSYGKTYEKILSARTHEQLLVPPGCVVGMQCLSDTCVFHYKQSTYYGEAKQFTVDYKDETLVINWPLKYGIISERDQQGSRFIDIPPREP
jgi:dTDP-4-dehydrorhamnose 3,5-epimerase